MKGPGQTQLGKLECYKNPIDKNVLRRSIYYMHLFFNLKERKRQNIKLDG